MGQEKRVRMMCLGGSTTALGNGYYPRSLDVFLRSNISETSYAINRGVSGVGPEWWFDSPGSMLRFCWMSPFVIDYSTFDCFLKLYSR